MCRRDYFHNGPTLLLLYILFLNLGLFTTYAYAVSEEIYEGHKTCRHDEDCDPNMKCEHEVCICARFYTWVNGTDGCHENTKEILEFLSKNKGERDYRGELDEEAKEVFFQLGIAGVLAVMLVAVGALGCVFTFCFIKSMKNRRKRLKAKRLAKAQQASRPLPPLPPENEDQTKEVVAGGAGLSQVTSQN